MNICQQACKRHNCNSSNGSSDKNNKLAKKTRAHSLAGALSVHRTHSARRGGVQRLGPVVAIA
ncbi:unnamed protein product, partial [Ceratitis capitata]